MTTIPYKPLCHDAERTMEDQIRLLAASAKRAFDAWKQQNQVFGAGGGGGTASMGGGGGGGSWHGPSPTDRLEQAMNALWHQLSETDIFMSGVHAMIVLKDHPE